MALLGILKKKKKEELELPPPPKIEDELEIPEITPTQETTTEEIPTPKKARLPPPIEPEPLPEFPTIPEFSTEQTETEETIVQDKTIKHINETTPQIIHKTPTRKTFVSYDDYTEITNNNEIINTKLTEAESLIKRLNELKNEENKTIDEWLDHLENIEKKLSQVDKTLSQSQS